MKAGSVLVRTAWPVGYLSYFLWAGSILIRTAWLYAGSVPVRTAWPVGYPNFLAVGWISTDLYCMAIYWISTYPNYPVGYPNFLAVGWISTDPDCMACRLSELLCCDLDYTDPYCMAVCWISTYPNCLASRLSELLGCRLDQYWSDLICSDTPTSVAIWFRRSHFQVPKFVFAKQPRVLVSVSLQSTVWSWGEGAANTASHGGWRSMSYQCGLTPQPALYSFQLWKPQVTNWHKASCKEISYIPYPYAACHIP